MMPFISMKSDSSIVTHSRIEMEAMDAIISSERHLDRIATTLENLEKFFIATSVEEVQKRVEDMKSGRS